MRSDKPEYVFKCRNLNVSFVQSAEKGRLVVSIRLFCSMRSCADREKEMKHRCYLLMESSSASQIVSTTIVTFSCSSLGAYGKV